MDIMSAFPSAYVKAGDLNGREVEVSMSHVSVEEIGGDRLPVLYFQGKEKGLVLNKTNATNISLVHGQNTDGWPGKRVTLFPATTDFNGRTVPCIRVKGPNNNGQNFHAPAEQQPVNHGASNGMPPAQSTNPFELNDSIPFEMVR